VTEAELQDAVMEALHKFGWLCYHTFDSRKSEVGFPDVIALRDERMFVIEFKTETGKVTPKQFAWLKSFEDIDGVETFVWRPRHLQSGVIDRVIQGKG
jgi:Holliday junction resolvase